MQKIKRIFYVIAILIMLPILFISGVILINSYMNPDEVPSFFGWKPFIVLSGSMETEIYAGDVAVVKEVDENTVKKGNIIAFRQGDIVITHRIEKIEIQNGEKVIYTKGDNNAEIDKNTVSLEQIEGVFVFKISGLGNAAMFIQTPTGIISCLSIPLGILIIMQISSSIKERKYEKEEEKRRQSLNEEIERLKKQNEELSSK